MGEQPTSEQLNGGEGFHSLEAFIRHHRDEFEEPWDAEAGWQAFCRNRPSASTKAHRRTGLLRSLPRLAAVSLAVLCLAAFARAYQVGKQETDALPEDLQQAQAYYEGEIHRTILEIQRQRDSLNPIPDNVLQTVERRGDEYRLLLHGLEENPGDEQVHAAFVEYYRSRLSFLEQLRSRSASGEPSKP